MLYFGVSCGVKVANTLQKKIIFSAKLANYIARMKHQRKHFTVYVY